ncbi:MAG: class I SAM-dependent DNA methyltransferase [Candidatus Acidiferrales bacterium]
MSLRDIAFWIRSAQADSMIGKLRSECSNQQVFDKLYENLGDPWMSAASCYRYQRLKYQRLVAMLPQRPFRRALDIGCGLGVLTRLLAPHVEEIVGVDVSQKATESASQMSTGITNVRYRQSDLRALDPASDGQFDLIVLADTVYYLSPLSDEALQSICRQVANLLVLGGTLLLANHFFFGFDRGSRLSRRIHDCFERSPGLRLTRGHRRCFYLVSLLERESSLPC